MHEQKLRFVRLSESNRKRLQACDWQHDLFCFKFGNQGQFHFFISYLEPLAECKNLGVEVMSLKRPPDYAYFMHDALHLSCILYEV